MEEVGEKIIAIMAFDNAMKANIIKTKLDAFGIPCFLTDEAFNGIYPIGPNGIFPGVRLHIFEKDIAEVKEILKEEELSPEELEKCPYCQSTRNEIDYSTEGKWWRVSLPLMLVLPPFRGQKVYRCVDCGKEF